MRASRVYLSDMDRQHVAAAGCELPLAACRLPPAEEARQQPPARQSVVRGRAAPLVSAAVPMLAVRIALDALRAARVLLSLLGRLPPAAVLRWVARRTWAGLRSLHADARAGSVYVALGILAATACFWMVRRAVRGDALDRYRSALALAHDGRRRALYERECARHDAALAASREAALCEALDALRMRLASRLRRHAALADVAQPGTGDDAAALVSALELQIDLILRLSGDAQPPPASAPSAPNR